MPNIVMKFFFKASLAGIIVPVAIAATAWPKSETKNEATQIMPRPYLIEVFDQNNNRSELNGQSLSEDLFSVTRELGADPYEKDKISIFPDMKFHMGGKITLYRTPSYKIIDGKKQYEVRTWARTVGDLFVEQNTEIGQDDKVSFARDYELEPGMTITIIRVARTLVTESEPIDFKTIKKDDPNLDQGKTKVEQAGKKGEKHLIYEVIREDGVQISKTLKRTEKVSEPVDEIIRIGTRPVITVPCKFNDLVIDAAIKNKLDANALCIRMMKESRGNPNSDGGDYKGLFQYESGFWEDVSRKAGYAGASIWDAKAQIYTTAWAWSHGYRGRWPSS